MPTRYSTSLPQIFKEFLQEDYSTIWGKMKAYSHFVYIICYIYRYTSIEIKPELRTNILKFVYGINY